MVEVELRLVATTSLYWSSTRSASVFCAASTATFASRRGHPGLCRVDAGFACSSAARAVVDRLLVPTESGRRAPFARSNSALALSRQRLADASCASRLADLRIAGGDLLADPADRRLLGRDLRFRLLQRDAVVGIVEEHQRRPRRDVRVVVDRHGLHVAGDLRRDDRRVGADIGIVGRDHEAAFGPPVVAVLGARPEGHQGNGEEQTSLRMLTRFFAGRRPAARRLAAVTATARGVRSASAGTGVLPARSAVGSTIGPSGTISPISPRGAAPIPLSWTTLSWLFSSSEVRPRHPEPQGILLRPGINT